MIKLKTLTPFNESKWLVTLMNKNKEYGAGFRYNKHETSFVPSTIADQTHNPGFPVGKWERTKAQPY